MTNPKRKPRDPKKKGPPPAKKTAPKPIKKPGSVLKKRSSNDPRTLPTLEPLLSRSTATEVQVQKLVARLRMRPHHTHELRAYGISHPAGRVRNLIECGYTVASDRVTTVDSDSFVHRNVALYSLVTEPPQINLFRNEEDTSKKGSK